MWDALVIETHTLPNVAIVGRPNVGKSALFNRLIGRKIAIVHDQPGITRDRLSATCTRCERPFILWDTGGIFGSGERDLTQQVQHAAENALRDSNLLLFVVDGKEGLSSVDEELARMLRKSQKPVVLVINKIDTEKHDPLAVEFDSLGFEKIISVSAEHDRGISQLLDAIELQLPSPAEIDHPTLVGRGRGERASNVEYPIAIAIVGRPNVGKSSLINSIVCGDRAIVSELPGTTRDAIDIAFKRDGRQFIFIDTAGIRRRGKVSSSAEVFSVMRAERSIRRADLCILVIDLSMGVTAQDKRIAGLIQKGRKPAIVVLNKWDLVKPRRGEKQSARELIEETRSRIFFLDYVPVLITSASTGENVDRLFAMIQKVQHAARKHIGTGVLNRLMRQAFEANPPPLVKGRRLKLFYATQPRNGGSQSAEGALKKSSPSDRPRSDVAPPEFVLFVNDPQSMTEGYRRYLEARIRETEPYPGLPIVLTLRPRGQKGFAQSRRSNARKSHK
ncbi:MAG: ribosome biogenesis GTPase Der [Verrucomicrobia bacterium]|nr:MAG: ribosome biogenesis GTPase Der [Verrucomicrobiota bacterium]